MDANDTGEPSNAAQAAPQVPLAAPQLGTGSKRRSRIAAISIVLVIILIAVVFIAVIKPPTTTATHIPAPFTQRSNILFGVPGSTPLYDYYNSSSNSTYLVQYGFSFMQPYIQTSAVVPPSTIIQVPQQYSNTTVPLSVSYYIVSEPNYSAAVSNYTTAVDTLMATFPNAIKTNSSVGSISSMFSYKAYGLNTYALIFVNGNYYVVLNIFGTPYLNQSYITGIAAHINSMMNAGV